MITFGSLFTGIGGFDLGFERAGMKCRWQVEKDKDCQRLLRSKWNVPIYDDVCGVGRETIEPVDVICGGFPCQDVSIAGQRAGLAGERSGLWHEFHRIVRELAPRWVVVENVPGLLSSNDGRDFAVILRGLVECGYGVCWRILDAQYFGVAQRRRRVFIVASLGSGRAAQVLFERTGGTGDIAARGETGEGTAAYAVRRAQTGSNGWGVARDVAHTLDGTGGDANIASPQPIELEIATVGGIGEYVRSDVSTSLRVGGDGHNGQGVLIARSLTARNERLDGETENFIVDARGNGEGRTRPTLTGDHAGRISDFTPIVFQQNQRDEVRDMNDVAGALAAEPGMHNQNFMVTNTLRAGAGAVKHKADATKLVSSHVGVRRLTPVECERLQGFPDGWTAGFADGVRYRMLGNAVAVPCAEWLGERLNEADEWK